MEPPVDRSFKISTLSSPLIKASEFARISRDGVLNGVEVDLLDSMRFRLQGWHAAPSDVTCHVDTVWFQPPLEQRVPEKALGLIRERVDQNLPARLVIDQLRGNEGETHDKQINLAIQLRRNLPETVRITIGIRPSSIENTRAHLARLAALRMQASEWDLDLAIDLGRELDWLWEAEAALYRIIGSLALVRLSYPTETFDGRFRASLSQRTVLTCAELDYRGAFSLIVPMPWWHWRNAKSLEAACLDAATRIRREMGFDPVPSGAGMFAPRLADMT